MKASDTKLKLQNSTSVHQKGYLNEILKQAANKKRIVCVFDLDSTLFNVSPRSQAILLEFAELHKPELKDVEILHTDWGIKEALLRAGYLSEEHPELHQLLKDFWYERFFTNEYLHYDIPYRGAVAYLQKLAQAQVEIHYLTGRDVARMQKGTIEVLKKWGFPLEEKNVHLKPHRSIDDHTFKVDWVCQNFPSQNNQDVYFFENEPVNINLVGQQRPDIKIVFIETTHSRRAQVEVAVATIEHFDSTE